MTGALRTIAFAFISAEAARQAEAELAAGEVDNARASQAAADRLQP